MGESRVTAVVIGTAIVGGIAFLMLAGCTVPQIDVTAHQHVVKQPAAFVDTAPEFATSVTAPRLVPPGPQPIPPQPQPTRFQPTRFQPLLSDTLGSPMPGVLTSESTGVVEVELVESPAAPATTADEESHISGVGEPVPVVGGIRSVDFRDGFTYPAPGFAPLVVVDGAASMGEPGSGDYVGVWVDDVIYGDLTGDGEDDAAVVTRSTRGASHQQGFVTVFSVNDGLLEDWGQTWNDYSASGGVVDVEIRNGLLVVASLDVSLTSVSSVVWATREPGYGLVRLEALPPRDWFESQGESAAGAHHLTDFLGARRAVLTVNNGDPAQVINFATEAPWVMMLTPLAGDGAFVRVRNATTGALVGDVHAGTPLELPEPAEYVGEVLFFEDASAEVVFELKVADARTLFAPTWEPRSLIEVDDNNAYRSVSLQWPEFTWSHGVADLAAVNATIEEYVANRRATHAQAVLQCADSEDAVFELSYAPTLVSYDLVSLEFDEFVGLCESGGTTRLHSLTIDLNTGRVVTGDRLIANSVQFHSQWWEIARSQNYWSGDEAVNTFEPVFDEFDAIALHPFGVTLTATFVGPTGDEMQLGATMSFEELDGFLDETIATRAKSGAAVALPVLDECGC